jgi:replicative DNA helicase
MEGDKAMVIESIKEVILISILQAEGEPLSGIPFSVRFLELVGDDQEIRHAILRASSGGFVGDLNRIAAILPREFIPRLSTLLNGSGLPIGIAEMEAQVIVEKSDRDKTGQRLAEIAQTALKNPDSAREELRSLLEIKPARAEPGMKGLFHEAIARYEELEANCRVSGAPTGFGEFDRVTGGLKPGQMTVVAAETNGGKSTFAMNVINHVLTQGKGVLLFTLEMDRGEIVDLLFSMNTEVNRNGFNTGKFFHGEVERMVNNLPRLSRFPLFIDDRATISAMDIAARMTALSSSVGLVVVDYIQIVSPADVRENREQQVAAIARSLRTSAKECKVPMLVMSQLNDEGKIRESRVVAHEAHNVLMLEVKGQAMNVRIVKGRSIPKFTFTLDYQPQYCILKDQREEG